VKKKGSTSNGQPAPGSATSDPALEETADAAPPTSTPSEDAGSLLGLLEAVAQTPDTILTGAEATSQPQPDLLGDGFTVRRRLGAGSFGVVYEALDHERGQTVALKVLNHLEPATLYDFKREFRALTNVRHRHLVQLYELHAHERHWFFSMELVEGCSLSELLARERGTVEGQESASLSQSYLALVRQVFTQLCHGVMVLHREGLLHRDLKPSNVQISHDGTVKLLDFGLILEQRGHTREGRIVGTPLYMSPEQALGTKKLTPASDWYSVGVMLFEALVGRAPFTATSRRALSHAKQFRVPAPPSQLVDGLPAELDQLCVGLLRRDPAERPGAEAIFQALAAPATPGESSTPAAWPRAQRPAVFVGRQRELASLQQALEEIQSTEGPIVCLVSGISGVGKSTLLDHFVASLEDDNVLVLRGASYHQESVPYKAWDMVVDMLSQYLSQLSLRCQDLLTPRYAGALKRIFPVLGQVEAIRRASDPPAGLDAREVRRRGFNAFRELMARLSDQHRLIVHLEDLQWSDIDSVELLLHLLGGEDTPRFLLLGSFRSDERESSPALRALLEQQAEPTFRPRLLPLEPLSPEEATSLASQLLGQTASLDRLEGIVRESGGNPIFVSELSHAATAFDAVAGAVDLDTIVLRRISELSGGARGLMEAVTVAGAPIRADQAAKAVGLKTGHDNVRELLGQHLLRIRSTPAGQQIETYHARIRDSHLRDLPEPRKVTLHAALARTLEQDETVDPERLAGHLFAAGDEERGWHFIRRAADDAVDTLAFARAARLCRKLLDESGPDEDEARRLQCALASALANTGRYDEAVRYFDAGLRHAQGAQPQGKLGIGVAVLWWLVVLFFRLYIPVWRRRPTDDQGALLDLRYEKTLSLVYVDPLRMFLESLALQKDLSRHPVRSTPRGLEIWSFVSAVLAFSGLSFALSRRILDRCNTVLDPTRDEEALSCGLSDLLIKFSVGDWAAISPLDGDLLQRNLDSGRFWHVSSCILYHALLHLGRGELDEAERLIEQLHSIAEEHKYRHVAGAYAFFLRVNLLVRTRRLADAEATIKEGLEYHREIGMAGPQILFQSALVLAELFKGDAGDAAAAREAMAAADRLVSQQAPAPPHYVAVYWIARVRLAQRLLEQAIEAGDRGSVRQRRRVCRADLGAATRNARRYAYGRAEILMLRGRQSWLEGRRGTAVRSWRAAIAEARRLGSKLDEARARFQLGSSLLEVGDRSSGETELSPEAQIGLACRLFDGLRASWDLERLHAWEQAHGRVGL
jgi:serine/threonine protein kinase/tetratricopeptide (TPR) repeat protein